MYTTRNIWRLLLSATALLSSFISQAGIPLQTASTIQYQAGDSILGFMVDGYYVAGADHLLHVDFIDSKLVEPIGTTTNEQVDGKPLALSDVNYHDLWPGISLNYRSAQKGIAQSTWQLDPGAEVRQIRLHYNTPVEIDQQGNLKIAYTSGWMRESAPIAWQEINGSREPVEVAFTVSKSGQNESIIGFTVGQYDMSQPLLIDPTLQWNTFFGSASSDYGHSITIDIDGNILIASTSYAAWGSSPKSSYNGLGDIVVIKLNRSGQLIWHTFLGSASQDGAASVATDKNGNIYITGHSQATWGTAPKRSYSGSTDATVAKLSKNGTLLWNTFLGSTTYDYGYTVAVDSSGSVYVGGRTDTTWGSNPINPFANGADGFVAKINTNGVLQWNTFLGSTASDSVRSIALDKMGNIYITGDSWGNWNTSPLFPHLGNAEAFAARLNNNGVRQWYTFLGSASYDGGLGIAVGDNGSIYLVGESNATWGTNPKSPYAGSADVFVARLGTNGTRQWHTFLGSLDNDRGLTIAVNQDGIFVAGDSKLSWASVVGPSSPQNKVLYVAAIDHNGVLGKRALISSTSTNEGNGIALDQLGDIYLTGTSHGTWGNPNRAYVGSAEIFVAKLRGDHCSFYTIKSKNRKYSIFCL